MKQSQKKGTATTNDSSKKLTVILPLFMLMFVVAATNYEAQAQAWPQIPNYIPPAGVITSNWWSDGGYFHIGALAGGTQGSQTNFYTINFGTGQSNQDLGRWQIGDQRQAFRIGRAWNNLIPSGVGLVGGGINLFTLNYNGVVGINLNNPWDADWYHRNPQNVLLATDVRFRVNGSAVAIQWYNTSDRRYKTGIASINTSKNLFGLNSVQYNPSSEALKEQLENFKNRSKDFSEEEFKSTVSSFEKQIAELDKDNSLHFGFIAQDLQKLFPNLVIEDEQGFLAVNYVGLIPVLVDAIQEQQKTLEEQHKMLEAQQRQINELLSKGFEKSGTNSFLNDARLEQNSPNPFNSSTEIKFYVPENSTVAGIHIYDMTGKELLRLDAPRGNSSVTLDARQLNAGMYLYSLIIDGREIDTKRMILTNN